MRPAAAWKTKKRWLSDHDADRSRVRRSRVLMVMVMVKGEAGGA